MQMTAVKKVASIYHQSAQTCRKMALGGSAIRISKWSELLIEKLTQSAYIRPPWLSISPPQTSCLGIAENRQPTKKYIIAEQVIIPSA